MNDVERPGDWRLTIRPEKDRAGQPTHAQRVRNLIKALLRGYGLRLVWIEEVKAGPDRPNVYDQPQP